jgi:hypothetical protein
LPQILRDTVPVVTSADQPLGSRTGLGDMNIFDVLLFKAGSINLGIGPQLTLPSATNDRLGTGRWQAGPAGVLIAPESWGLLGGLITYQHSFGGGNGRPVQNNLQAQPFVIYNLPQGFYLRSTATWNFDLQRGNYYIPIGLGAGKIWNLPDGTAISATGCSSTQKGTIGLGSLYSLRTLMTTSKIFTSLLKRAPCDVTNLTI